MSAAQPDPAKRPVRVVSLLPSATEMLSLLGAEIVGRSHECDWPLGVRDRVPALTGAYNKFENSAQMHEAVTQSLSSGRGLYWLDAERLAQLAPDAIVTQSLCSVCAVDLDIVRKAAAKIFPQPRIIDTNPMSLQDVIADVRRLGEELGLAQRGAEAAAALQARVDQSLARAAELAATAAAAALAAGAPPPRPTRVVFLEWTSPLFPGGHWTPQMIHMAGGVCPVNPPRDGGAGGAAPSKETDPAEVVAADPDLIIVAPCGLDLETTRREVALLEAESWWRGLRAVQSGRVALVDGNQHFNRPGPRLVEALEWLVAVLAPVRGGDKHQQQQQQPAGQQSAAVAAAAEHLMPPEFPWEWLPALPPLPPPPAAAEAAVQAGGPGERESVATAAPTGPSLAGSLLTDNDNNVQERLRPLGNGASSGWIDADAAAASASAAGAAALSPPCTPLRAATATHAGTEPGGGGGGCHCNGGGGGGGAASAAAAAAAATDPWVVTRSPWASAPHLPPDIEDLHAAACESGKSSYDDPETGYMVFTQVALAKRGLCCANRCRHCPWGHFRVQGRTRLNRITSPSLLHPSPAAQRAWKQNLQQKPNQKQQQAGRAQQLYISNGANGIGNGIGTAGGGGGGAAAAAGGAGHSSGAAAAAAGGGGGLTFVCHEGCAASDELVVKTLAEAKRTAPDQRVVLLVAFDADTGALWARSGGCSNGHSNGHCSTTGDGGCSGTSHSGEPYSAVHIGPVMDASLRHDLSLVAVPLQVPKGGGGSGSTCPPWIRDPTCTARALVYVVRTAAELTGAESVARVVAVRPDEGTPDMFVQGTAGAVPGGWPEVVRRANAELLLAAA
ncbi:hypothetical protein PLESTB_000945000 [Pleodorina starrii]|uniref:Fe/B12 periplasmic-binding domain-containing protein n=1 Tax=Pleodorina starrii TaxID=330485 RepID=A0A9W6F444_9CHLO|nr:hypothetical protein PLESTM_001153700 [Pleodorina starrii]GLC55110.1 hypothetical protein PLESTB_000945000 [Pleodorina starrii]GLC71135.1 hypothetical protein PLESTF_001078200 [Pleodorina starrii]